MNADAVIAELRAQRNQAMDLLAHASGVVADLRAELEKAQQKIAASYEPDNKSPQ